MPELLYTPDIKIETWRSKRGPALCHRCQAALHSSHASASAAGIRELRRRAPRAWLPETPRSRCQLCWRASGESLRLASIQALAAELEGRHAWWERRTPPLTSWPHKPSYREGGGSRRVELKGKWEPGNLLLGQSVLNKTLPFQFFLSNSRGIASWIAKLNAALCLVTWAKKWKYYYIYSQIRFQCVCIVKNHIIMIFQFN